MTFPKLRWLVVCLILLPSGTTTSSQAQSDGTRLASFVGPRRPQNPNALSARVTVSLVREARLSVPEAGIVRAVHVTDGREVRAGDPIVSLDDREQQQQHEAAKLSLDIAERHAADTTAIASAEAQLRETVSGKQLKEVALQIAQAEAAMDVSVQIADAEMQLNQRELERAEVSRESFRGSVSVLQIERLKTAVAKSRLEREAAEEHLKIAKLKPAAEQAAIQQKKDEILRYESVLQQKRHEHEIARLATDLKRSEVQAAELKLQRRRVEAPFDGIVLEVATEQGEWVEPGTVVARLLDLQTLQVEGFLPVANARQDLVGRPVHVQLGGGLTIDAEVVYLSPEVDPINQQVRFRAEFENTNRTALPGMKGMAEIRLAKPSSDSSESK